VGAGREEAAGRRVQTGRAEEDGRIVGGEGEGKLGRRVRGQPAGRSALGRHDEDVEVAVAVAGEGDGPAVVAPDRHEIVRLVHGQGDGRAAGGRDAVEVALESEDDGSAVGGDGRSPQPGRGGLGRCDAANRGDQDKADRDLSGNAGFEEVFHGVFS